MLAARILFGSEPLTRAGVSSCSSLRRGRESNPRWGFPHARLASGYHRPLGHLSKSLARENYMKLREVQP